MMQLYTVQSAEELDDDENNNYDLKLESVGKIKKKLNLVDR